MRLSVSVIKPGFENSIALFAFMYEKYTGISGPSQPLLC